MDKEQNTIKENEDSEVVVKIENLCKEYKMFDRKADRLIEAVIPGVERHKTFKALDNINLEIRKGEVLGILGKNGAGKSTLLKIITGVVTPTSGKVEIKGKISSLLELGAAFNMELTGVENIYQHGEVMGLSKEEIEKRKPEIIEFADIGDHLYQPVKTYSSGMFARLAFACAINVDPDILIVDEVLSVGDMAFQLKCFKKFEEFKNKGKTILFVTHSVADVIRNCNRSIIISSGEKIFDGDVKTGVDKYKKIIVGIDDDEVKKDNLEILEDEQNNEDIVQENSDKKDDENKTVDIHKNDNEIWKEHFVQNPDMLSYGEGKAEIIDYGIFDENGDYQATLNNNQEYTVKMKVKFNEEIDEPIFAMSVKDFKGLELGGVNTKAYKKLTGAYEKGEIAIVEFKQSFPLAPEKYTLSFGCTKFTHNGDLEVFDRKYDALFVEIISYRECLGVIDLKSDINITKGLKE